MQINIGFGISNDWCEYACTTITSILVNACKKDEYTFYILMNDISDFYKEMFYRLNKIKKSQFEFIEIDDSYFNGAIHDWLGVSASYRLRFQTLVDIDKILYLDADIIAEKNIAELYSIDIEGYLLAAVEDKYSTIMCKRVNLNEGEVFFNSGMQLINLKKYREEDIESQFMEKLRKSDFYTDQDVLNDVCKNRILSLPLIYNVMPRGAYEGREREAKDAVTDPVLFHYARKPWSNDSVPFIEKWHKYNDIYLNL